MSGGRPGMSHYAERYRTDPEFRERVKAYRRASYKRNRKKDQTRSRVYYTERADELCEQARERYHQDEEKQRARSKIYYHGHADDLRAKRRGRYIPAEYVAGQRRDVVDSNGVVLYWDTDTAGRKKLTRKSTRSAPPPNPTWGFEQVGVQVFE